MTARVGCWLRAWFWRNWYVFIVGMFAGWLAMAWRPPEGIERLDLTEAEGPQFADPTSLEIVYTKRQNRVCYSVGQDWIWREVNRDGQTIKLRKALDSSVVPFGDTDPVSILSIDVPRSVDVSLPWQYRRTIEERCDVLPPWMPSWIRSWFVSRRLLGTKDVPVNFVGAPHAR